MYDVIVVGARCAGSPLAMLLARRGHRVLAVDRATFPSDTVSTHFIHQTGLARLRDWGLLDRLRATGVPPVRHMTFSYDDIHAEGFADAIDGITEVLCPRRTVLDALLVDAARAAGAEVIEGFTVTETIVADGRVTGIRGYDADGSETAFGGRFVVGADGVDSTLARLVGAEVYRNVPASGFVYYSYFDGLDWGFHNRTAHGRQFASCPTHDGRTMVAVMRRRDAFGEFRADVEESFRSVVAGVVPEFGADLRAATRTERFRGLRYADSFYRRSHGPGWALVGDAGYHKDPLTAWGITDAFRHAELLAEALHRGLSGESPIDGAVADYVARRDRASAGTFAFTVAVAALTLPPFLHATLSAATRSPAYRAKFFAMVGGGYPGEEFFAPDHLAALYEEVGTPPDLRLLPPSPAPAGHVV
ncbi:NAD(P)/FAD-dependent oxidoreductase [Frankia sp. AiPs1]|uniref:NAD(P)/FAD-dependent oxidoreductase n=1 Tax=Frankia sp. AiPs1 TaxID=573493 RepID=UPI0020432870|nr:NAD(P)/FAD-dependent oxidoreductase [Frankia sp. AiPs1]MCM3921470.1 NAD(P)/FAD-dependent oxidoreductase [Frankia sp. AiPs1]